MKQKIDKTIEREVFAHDADDPPDNCPQCSQPLVQDSGPYQVVTRSGRRVADEYAASGDFGYLCPGCATAVIHIPKLAAMLQGASMKSGWETGEEFMVVGLVNMDAIPPDQAHVPLDDLDPYPFVPFYSTRPAKKRGTLRKKRLRKPQKRRRK